MRAFASAGGVILLYYQAEMAISESDFLLRRIRSRFWMAATWLSS